MFFNIFIKMQMSRNISIYYWQEAVTNRENISVVKFLYFSVSNNCNSNLIRKLERWKIGVVILYKQSNCCMLSLTSKWNFELLFIDLFVHYTLHVYIKNSMLYIILNLHLNYKFHSSFEFFYILGIYLAKMPWNDLL